MVDVEITIKFKDVEGTADDVVEHLDFYLKMADKDRITKYKIVDSDTKQMQRMFVQGKGKARGK